MRNRVISGTTRICGVIGDPIEHTMSPVMHNAIFKETGMDYVYVAFQVKKEGLGEAIRGMRALNIRGLNVTIPHKVDIIPFLDELDPLAERIGAVNTVVNDDGVLTGYNTDAEGFLQALLEKGVEPRGKNVVVLGAGGASRAISFILAERGADLVIVNRTLDKAKECASRIGEVFQKEVKTLDFDNESLARALAEADILVNATSVGMSPGVDVSPVPSKLLDSRLVVFDIVYNPIKTKLLREAEAVGTKTVGGLNMLAWQGASALELFTGQKAPVNLMRKEAIKVLSGDEK